MIAIHKEKPTYEKLSELRGLDSAILRRQSKIAGLEARAVSTVGRITGMPGTTDFTDNISRCVAEIYEEKQKLRILLDKKAMVDEYIRSVRNTDVQEALTMYINERSSWQRIAYKLQYSESGIRHKVKQYMENA